MALRAGAKVFSRVAARSVSTFALPELKYGYAALEPHFDEKTMTVSFKLFHNSSRGAVESLSLIVIHHL